jgi:hypothetical protein
VIGWFTQPTNSRLILQSMMKYLGLARLAYLSWLTDSTFWLKLPHLCLRIQCVRGGGGTGFWASERKTPAAKSLYRSILLDADILHWLPLFLSFYAHDTVHGQYYIHSFFLTVLLNKQGLYVHIYTTIKTTLSIASDLSK